MQLHDDDPELFALILKFAYTNVYVKEECQKPRGDEKTGKWVFSIQLTTLG